MSRILNAIVSTVFCTTGFVCIAVADTTEQAAKVRLPALAEVSNVQTPEPRRLNVSYAIRPADLEAGGRLLNRSPAAKNAALESQKQNRKSDLDAFYARREAARLSLDARQRDWEETRKAWQQKQRDAKSSR